MPRKPSTKDRTKSGRIEDLPLESRQIDSAQAVVGGAPPKQPDRPNNSISLSFTKIET